MQRTYSRKHLRRAHKVAETPSDTSPERSLSPPRRKRRKVEVETIHTSLSDRSPVQSGNSAADFDDIGAKGSFSSRLEGADGDHGTPPTAFGTTRHTSARTTTYGTTSRSSGPSSLSNSVASSSKHTHSAASGTRVVLQLSNSPEKAVKDLSNLFDFSETSISVKPASKSGSIARRMLRRAQTDSSISVSSVDQVQSGPSTPRKLAHTKTETFVDYTHHSPDASGSLPPTPSKSASLEDIPSFMARPSLTAGSSNIRTYGGKSRSFLVALPTGDQSITEDFSLGDNPGDDFALRESYDELRARWGVDNSEDDPYPVIHDSPGSKRKGKGKQVDTPVVHLPNGMMNDLKSITELRSKGESRRFLDDMGYLFEGLATKAPLGVRRGSAIEIVSKLCDVEFARKAKAADFLGRAWEAIREAGAGNGDKVLDIILVLFSALIARNPRDLPELASKSDFVPTLFSLLGTLDQDNDPLWLLSCGLSDLELKQVGIGKVDKALLVSLHNMAHRKSDLFNDEERNISGRLLLTYTLSALPPAFISSSNLRNLIKAFNIEIEHLPSRIKAYASGLPLVPKLSSSSRMHAFSLMHVDNCLRLLDSYLLGRWSETDETTPTPIPELDAHTGSNLATSLTAICAATDIVLRDPDLQDLRATANRCMESSFRVLINLTHDSTSWCRALLRDSLTLLTLVRIVMTSYWKRDALLVKTEDGDTAVALDESDIAAQLLDRLCLALGVLTNLIQSDTEAHTELRELQLDSHCAGTRGCTVNCQCGSRLSGLHCLTLVYLELCRINDELDVVVRGHIAVLFGLLMKGNIENQRMLLEKLPGTTKKKKLTGLVDNAREFTLFYVEFAKKVSAAARGRDEEVDVGDTAVDRDVEMGRVLRDAQGASVARNVVLFLTELRDQVHS